MDKKIKSVRKSIKERKKIRHVDRLAEGLPRFHESITDEERHGLPRDYISDSHKPIKERNKESFPFTYFYQLLGSFILFFGTFFVVKGEAPYLDKPKQFATTAFQEHFPFATVYDWYVEHLGRPLALVPEANQVPSSTNDLYESPLHGEVVESFRTNGTGIQIMPKEESSVRAVNNGVVIFAGSRPHTDNTIIIQHPDRTVTTYGKLNKIDVHLFQIINKHDVIGRIDLTEAEETLFFSIEERSGFIDPAEVINVDGSP